MIKLCKDCVNELHFGICNSEKIRTINLTNGEKDGKHRITQNQRHQASNAALGICGADGIFWEGKE